MSYTYEIIEALYDKYSIENREELAELANILFDLYCATECSDFNNEFVKLCYNHNLNWENDNVPYNRGSLYE